MPQSGSVGVRKFGPGTVSQEGMGANAPWDMQAFKIEKTEFQNGLLLLKFLLLFDGEAKGAPVGFDGSHGIHSGRNRQNQ